MSRRTEMAYKAESLGKSAPHDNAPGLGDTVNAAVALRKITFLSGETCSTGGRCFRQRFVWQHARCLDRSQQRP